MTFNKIANFTFKSTPSNNGVQVLSFNNDNIDVIMRNQEDKTLNKEYKVTIEEVSHIEHNTTGMMGSTRLGEMGRTAEMLVEMATKHQDNPHKVAMEILYMIRSANRIEEKDLKDLQDILDNTYKSKKTN